MFDIAYENEASICVAEIMREKIWLDILSAPSDIPLSLCLALSRIVAIRDFWSIMFLTHGV